MLTKILPKEKTTSERIAALLFLFFGGSVAGWVWEVLFQLVKTGVLDNRGMLHGPWLPIYGVGCLLMIFLKAVFEEKPLRFFAAAFVVSALVEYSTSFMLEKVYRIRWWDYTGYFMNLHGRVYLAGLLFFASMGLLVAYVVLPALERLTHRISWPLKEALCCELTFFFLLDLFISLVFPNVRFGATHI